MGSKNSNGESYGKGRTRNYATMVYPESAPENWQTVIAESKIPVFISPLHDKDINPDGTPKKPHYHVLTSFDSVKTVDQAKEFLLRSAVLVVKLYCLIVHMLVISVI